MALCFHSYLFVGHFPAVTAFAGTPRHLHPWDGPQDPWRRPTVNIRVRSCLCCSRKWTKAQMAPDSMHSPKTCRDHWTNETSEGKWQIHPKETSQEGEWTVNSGRHKYFHSSSWDFEETDTVLLTQKWRCCVYWLYYIITLSLSMRNTNASCQGVRMKEIPVIGDSIILLCHAPDSLYPSGPNIWTKGAVQRFRHKWGIFQLN